MSSLIFFRIHSDLHLRYISPCINAGNPDTTGLLLPPTDFDGNPRIFQKRIDMGAYEFQEIIIATSGDGLNQKLTIFPNPASAVTRIAGNAGKGKLFVYGMKGNMIDGNISVDLSKGNTLELNVSTWAPGVYTIVLQNEDRTTWSGNVVVTQ
jgi:hypothetical protein